MPRTWPGSSPGSSAARLRPRSSTRTRPSGSRSRATNLAVTDATMRFLAPHGPVRRAWRNLVLGLAPRSAWFRRRVNSGSLAEPATYTVPGSGPVRSGAPASSGPWRRTRRCPTASGCATVSDAGSWRSSRAASAPARLAETRRGWQRPSAVFGATRRLARPAGRSSRREPCRSGRRRRPPSTSSSPGRSASDGRYSRGRLAITARPAPPTSRSPRRSAMFAGHRWPSPRPGSAHRRRRPGSRPPRPARRSGRSSSDAGVQR